MAPIVCILGAGLMGAAVGQRLVENGVTVLGVLEGRSENSRRRAESAGILPVSLADSLAADIVLSILPPAEALNAARAWAAVVAPTGGALPVYVDCNAVSPATARDTAALIEAAGMPFVDACIIGHPPRLGARGPAWYLADRGDAARVAELGSYGLRMSLIEGEVGAASAFKMCYGGLLKGTAAIGSAMVIAADRIGAGDMLHAEMADSMPGVLAFLEEVLPNMPSRSRRWVAEMEEVASFVDGSRAETYHAIARFYAALADDYDGEAVDIAATGRFAKGPPA